MRGVRRVRVLEILFIVSVASTLVGCGSSPATDPPGEPNPTSASSAGPASHPTPTEVPAATLSVTVVEPDAGVLPRAIAYGGLTWTIKHAVITNQDPGRYVAGETGTPTPLTHLILDLGLQNDNTVVGVLLDNARWIAKLADGTTVMGANQKQVGVPPSSTAVGRYAFEVPAGTSFTGLFVSIADPGKEPSVEQPLSGQAAPVEVQTASEPGETAAVPLPRIEMTWTIQKLVAGRDWALPLGFVGGTLPGGERADAGTTWLGVVVRVQVDKCGCPGGVLDQAGNTRLFIDGTPYTATAKTSSNQIVNAQTVSDVQLVFAIPAGTTKATLQVGPLDTASQQVRFELDVP